MQILSLNSSVNKSKLPPISPEQFSRFQKNAGYI
jgi:hypothetical protein